MTIHCHFCRAPIIGEGLGAAYDVDTDRHTVNEIYVHLRCASACKAAFALKGIPLVKLEYLSEWVADQSEQLR